MRCGRGCAAGDYVGGGTVLQLHAMHDGQITATTTTARITITKSAQWRDAAAGTNTFTTTKYNNNNNNNRLLFRALSVSFCLSCFLGLYRCDVDSSRTYFLIFFFFVLYFYLKCTAQIYNKQDSSSRSSNNNHIDTDDGISSPPSRSVDLFLPITRKRLRLELPLR